MPNRMTEEQRQEVLQMLARGEDRDTIAADVGVTPGSSVTLSHATRSSPASPSYARSGSTALGRSR